MLATASGTGVGIGLVVTAVGFGFRHGIDWDHLAALADITGSQDRARGSVALATFYAAGHALVVFLLGLGAVLLSAELPGWVDGAMERVVGVTLLVLGAYVVLALLRNGRDFRLRSRWMLVISGARRGARWLRRRRPAAPVVITHEHEHVHSAGGLHDHQHPHDHGHPHGHEPAPLVESTPTVLASTHRHVHRHVGTMPDDPFPTYGRATAFGVGMLHGVGAETPTQVVVFAAAAGAGGTAAGILVLVCFLAGLLASNTVVALAATFGFLGAARNFGVYAAISVVTALFSLALGTLFVVGQSSGLPVILGG